MRQGNEADWKPEKMMSAEMAVIKDKKELHFAYADGKTKRVATEDDISKLSGQNSGKGWTSEQITLLETIGNYLVFTDATTGQAIFDNLIASLRSGASDDNTGGGEEPDTPVIPDVPDEPDTPTYTITKSLVGCTLDNNATTVQEGGSYTANVTFNYETYNIENLTITMGGVNITNSAYSNGVISIPEVTGNVVIAITVSEVVTLLYELLEPTTFDGNTVIDTGVSLWDVDKDWSVVFDAESLDESSKTLFCFSIYDETKGISNDNTLALAYTYSWGSKKWLVYSMGYKNEKISGTTTTKGIVVHTKGKQKPVLYLSDTIGIELLSNNSELTSNHLYLGGRMISGELSDGFKGTVNNFKVYDRVLTTEEIATYLGV